MEHRVHLISALRVLRLEEPLEKKTINHRSSNKLLRKILLVVVVEEAAVSIPLVVSVVVALKKTLLPQTRSEEVAGLLETREVPLEQVSAKLHRPEWEDLEPFQHLLALELAAEDLARPLHKGLPPA
jgi:hypothetical protein